MQRYPMYTFQSTVAPKAPTRRSSGPLKQESLVTFDAARPIPVHAIRSLPCYPSCMPQKAPPMLVHTTHAKRSVHRTQVRDLANLKPRILPNLHLDPVTYPSQHPVNPSHPRPHRPSASASPARSPARSRQYSNSKIWTHSTSCRP